MSMTSRSEHTSRSILSLWSTVALFGAGIVVTAGYLLYTEPDLMTFKVGDTNDVSCTEHVNIFNKLNEYVTHSARQGYDIILTQKDCAAVNVAFGVPTPQP